MKRFILVTVLLAAVSVFTVHPAQAVDLAGKWAVGARVSYADPIDDTVQGIDVEFDGTPLIEANLAYHFNSVFSIELGVGYLSSDIQVKASGVSLEFGEITQVPVLLTLRAHIPTGGSIVPYVGAGVGYYFNDFDFSNLFNAAFAAIQVNNARGEVDDSFGFHVNGGVDVFVTDSVALNLDLKYIWNQVDFTFSAAGVAPVTSEFDVDVFTAGVGLKFLF